MALYIYKARDAAGALVSGEMQSEGEKEVLDKLVSQGLFPVSVKPSVAALSLKRWFYQRIDPKALVVFTRQFYTMFKAGVPMDNILTALERQATHEDFKKALSDIQTDVSSGSTLENAFKKHPRYFSDLYTSMLSVGEVGGVLEKTLSELAKVLHSEIRIKSQVKSATLYPKFVIGVIILVFILMVTFVIPQFEQFYAGHNAILPLPTRILLGISHFFRNFWYLVLAFAGFMYFLWRTYAKSRAGRMQLDALKFHLPVFGNLTFMVSNTRFCHLISALYRSGLPLPRSLDVVASTIGNVAYAKDVNKIKEAVETGRSLSEAMSASDYFTPMVIEVTAIGEISGAIDEMLESAAAFYDDEIADLMKILTTLIEPLLLVVVFGMVALLALAIFLPIWNLANVVMPGGS